MKRVLFISYFFPPAGGAGVQRTTRFAKYLREFGYEPIVLAPHPSTYRLDPLSLGTDPSFLKELPQDLRVYRVAPCQPFGLLRILKKLKLLWAFNFVVRPDEKLTWSFPAISQGLDIARREKIDLIYQNLGPWSTSLVGFILKSILQKPLVYDVRDPWTQWAMGSWPTRLHFVLERKIEEIVTGVADRISMLGDTYRAELLQAHPRLDPGKVVAIPNGYDAALLPPARTPERARAADATMHVVHAGKFYDTWGASQRTPLSALLKAPYDFTLGRLRYSPRKIDNAIAGPRYLLQALAILRKRHPATARNISVEFLGRTHPAVRDQVQALGLGDMVALPGQVPHDVCVRKLFQADVLFLPLFRWRNGAPMGVLPLKLYEYMYTQNPVLCAVPDGDLKRTLSAAGTGIFAQPDDPEDIAQKLLDLHAQHTAGGIKLKPDWNYIRQFDRRELTRKLAQVFDSVLRTRRRTTS